MSSRCLAKMSLNSIKISSMSFWSFSVNWESSHLKFLRNASRSSALLLGSSFWIFQFLDFPQYSALNRRVGIRVARIVWCGEPKVLTLGRLVRSFQEFVDV